MPVEKEYSGVENAAFATDRRLETATWQVTKEPGGLECITLNPTDCSVRISPSSKSSPSALYSFHRDLRSPNSQPLVLLFEARSRAMLSVCLSPDTENLNESTYEIIFGESGNTKTLLRFRTKRLQDRITATAPGRHCQTTNWTSYWVCLDQKHLFAGLGKIPGSQVISVLNNSEEKSLIRPFVGFGNGESKNGGGGPAFLRGIKLATCPDFILDKLQSLTTKDLAMITSVADTEEDRKLLEEYQEECRKARARAEKFGVEYLEPKPEAFLNWSEAKKLRSNANAGFATGIDLMDPKEQEKQEARRKRFEVQLEQLKETDENAVEEAALDVIQAWDNETLVKDQRVDPPPTLWVPPLEKAENVSDLGDFAIQTEEPAFSPNKVHIFSIDWAAFKQIRTNDIMGYFSIYGPTYVEWLSDLSCNIHFQDQFSAARALENISQRIPSPPPDELETSETVPSDLGRMGWRLGKKMLYKVKNDRFGRRGTRARLLMRIATTLDILHERPSSWKSPPGFSSSRVLGPGSETRGTKAKEPRKRNEATKQKGDPMVQGLSSGRAGFSVEEIEAERAKKRMKFSES